MLYNEDEIIVFSKSFDKYLQELIKLCNFISNDEQQIFENLLRRTFNFAEKAHRGQTRKKRDIAYITHPIQVSLLVAKFNNIDLIITALLHDVVEDTDVTMEELGTSFESTVTSLVDILTKPDLLKYESKTERAKRMFDKFKNASKDEKLTKNALLIKLADRYANLQTIEALDVKRREEYLVETERYLLPIAEEYEIDFLVSDIKEIIKNKRL